MAHTYRSLSVPWGTGSNLDTPLPKTRLDGLIVWEQPLKRQQDFSPRIVFMP